MQKFIIAILFQRAIFETMEAENFPCCHCQLKLNFLLCSECLLKILTETEIQISFSPEIPMLPSRKLNVMMPATGFCSKEMVKEIFLLRNAILPGFILRVIPKPLRKLNCKKEAGKYILSVITIQPCNPLNAIKNF